MPLRTGSSGSARIVGVHVPQAQLDRADRGATAWLPPVLAHAETWNARTVVFSDPDPLAGLRRVRQEEGVTAFLFNDSTFTDPRALELWRARVPFAVMGRLHPPLPQSWVDLDNRHAIQLGLDHLAERGHRRIGFVASSATGYWWDERLEGYTAWVRTHGVEPRIARGPHHRLPDLLRQMLTRDDRPTAVLSSGDGTCLPVYAVAAELGLTVGGKDGVAVAGFDPELVLDPPLTTVVVDHAQVAVALWEQLAAEAGWSRRGLFAPAVTGRFVACGLRVGLSG